MVIGARTLQGTCPGGPNIRAVIRRRTIRLSDNALIDDVDLSVPTRKFVLFRRIPGPIDIRTDFYYLPGKCGQYNSELATGGMLLRRLFSSAHLEELLGSTL